jgi:uncharacterized protein (DUF305 family)
MIGKLILSVGAAAFMLAAAPDARAQTGTTTETTRTTTKTTTQQAAPMTPAMRGYHTAMRKMRQDMPHRLTGDPDIDFARHMVPHHQAAIDMARVEAEHGKDPALKEMAQKMIEAQSREVGQLEAWLKDHPLQK